MVKPSVDGGGLATFDLEQRISSFLGVTLNLESWSINLWGKSPLFGIPSKEAIQSFRREVERRRGIVVSLTNYGIEVEVQRFYVRDKYSTALQPV